MPTSTDHLTQRPAWKALEAHYQTIKDTHLRELFAQDPRRGERLTLGDAGIYLDYSKNRVTDETIRLLLGLAEECGLRERADAMFRGDKINVTERRAVLHTALRAPRDAVIDVDGQNVVPEVHAVLDRMAAFSDRVRSGDWKGYTGKRITTVINIGIGGSDLGPVMAYTALRHYSQRDITCRFVSNVDGTDLAEAVRDADPEQTLFIISSKTFTTLETLTNARSARDWFLKTAGDETAVAKHFAAVSTNAAEVEKFGIDTANMFGFWDWVGGRYSSRLGHRPLADARDRADRLREMLDRLARDGRALPHRPLRAQPAGAAGPDRPLVQRLLSRASDPRRAPLRSTTCTASAYLQQLDMESNGKSVDAGRQYPSTTRQARSSGAPRAPTASTPTTS